MMSFIILVEWLVVSSEYRTQSKLEFLQFILRLLVDRHSITKFQRAHRGYPSQGHAGRIAHSGASGQIAWTIDRTAIDKSAQAHGLLITHPGKRRQHFRTSEH